MESLKTTFRIGGFTQNLVKRDREVAVYTVEMDEGEIIGYEIYLIYGMSVAYTAKTKEKADEYFTLLTRRLAMQKFGIEFSEN